MKHNFETPTNLTYKKVNPVNYLKLLKERKTVSHSTLFRQITLTTVTFFPNPQVENKSAQIFYK